MEKKRKIVPPVYLFITLLLMWLLQRYFPLHQYINPPAAYVGIALVVFGIFMAAISAGQFASVGTGLEPFDEATILVNTGFYRFTRNPMYMGMFGMLFGVALLLGSIGALLPIPLFMLVIRNHFVLAEERFLEAAFGQAYLGYKTKVRRWL